MVIPKKGLYVETSAKIEATQEITQETTQEIIEEKIETSSRGNEYREPIKNKELTVNSNLRVLSNLEAKDYDKMLEGTALKGLGETLAEIENKYKINGLYIMGLACEESAYGTSKFARERNNLTGMNAVDSNPNKATRFNSKSDCLDYTAKRLDEKYLTKGAVYFSGYTPKSIDKHYCTDTQHCYKIINIVNKLTKKI